MATLDIYKKLALRKFEQHPLVASVSHNFHFIRIVYTNGIKEAWMLRNTPLREGMGGYQSEHFRHVLAGDGILGQGEVPIHREFECNPLDCDYEDKSKHFILQYHDFDKAYFMNQRLAVIRLIEELCDEGWVPIRYPKEALKKDWDNIRNEDLGIYETEDTIQLYPLRGHKRAPGSYILEHFLPFGYATRSTMGGMSLKQAWLNPKMMYMAISIILSKNRDVTRHELIRTLNSYDRHGRGGLPHYEFEAGPRIYPANFFRAVFEKLGITSKGIFDLRPDFGAKMLCCAAMDVNYYSHPNNPWIRYAKRNGFEDFGSISIEHENPSFDLILVDNNFTPVITPHWTGRKLVFGLTPIGDHYVKVQTLPAHMNQQPQYFSLLE